MEEQLIKFRLPRKTKKEYKKRAGTFFNYWYNKSDRKQNHYEWIMKNEMVCERNSRVIREWCAKNK